MAIQRKITDIYQAKGHQGFIDQIISQEGEYR